MAGRHRFSAEQDYVEVVVKQLKAATKKDIDRDVITKTQETLRILRTKAHPRTLGVFDTESNRAAILLDYVVRKEKNAVLCQKSVLKDLGLTSKKKHYTKLYDVIGNYLNDAAVVPLKTNATSKKSGQGSTQQSLISGSTTIDPPAEDDYNNIPRLAIRLSSLIHDPHGFAVQAEKLFQDIQRFVLTLEMPRRADQLNDIQRFRACYGAACLYHLVAQTQTKKLSRQMQRKQQQTNNASNKNHHADEDPNCPLEVEDILKACPHFSPRDFKEVCKHVEKLANEMEKTQFMASSTKETGDPTTLTETTKSNKTGAKRGAHKGQQGRKRTASSSSTKEADSSHPSKKKRAASTTSKTNGAHDNHSTTGLARDGDDDENFRRSRANAIEIPSVFEWRKQVLAEACDSARKDLESQGESSDNLTNSVLLAAAADKVLQRFGLAAT